MVVLNGKEGLECEVYVDGIRLDHFTEFKFFEYVLDESCTYRAECSKRWRVGGGLQIPSRICSLSVL